MPYFVLILQRRLWTHGLTRFVKIRRSMRAMVVRTMMVVHMTSVLQWNSANTNKQPSGFSPGRGSEQGSHTHTLSPCPAREWDYVSGLALISASMSRVGGSEPSGVDQALTQQITWSQPDQSTLHMQLTTATCRNTVFTFHCVDRVFQSVSRRLLGCFWWLQSVSRRLLGCFRLLGWFGWLPECC